MFRNAIDTDGFEAKFQENIDPWNYTNSAFEAFKRGVLLRACGTRQYGRGLELACAIGETTLALAQKCLRLTAVDSSSTALKEAARRTAHLPNVRLLQAILPDQLPSGQFDLIVASEIFYYLRPDQLEALLEKLDHALAPGGRLVILHHIRSFDDAATPPKFAQARAAAKFGARRPQIYEFRSANYRTVALQKPSAIRRPAVSARFDKMAGRPSRN